MNVPALIAAILIVNAGFMLLEVILHVLIIFFVVNPNQEKEREEIIEAIRASFLGKCGVAIHPIAFWWLEAYQWVSAFWQS